MGHVTCMCVWVLVVACFVRMGLPGPAPSAWLHSQPAQLMNTYLRLVGCVSCIHSRRFAVSKLSRDLQTVCVCVGRGVAWYYAYSLGFGMLG